MVKQAFTSGGAQLAVPAPHAFEGQKQVSLRPSQGLRSQELRSPGQSRASGPLPIVVFWNSIRRHWHLAVPLGILCAALLAGVAWKLSVPTYTANCMLRIDANDHPLMFRTADEADGNAGLTSYRLYKNTQKQLITTPFVLNAALRDPEIAALETLQSQPDPVAWLQQQITVSFPSDGELMKVAMATESATDGVKIVNAAVKAYLDEVVNKEEDGRRRRLTELENVYDAQFASVQNLRNALKTNAESLGTGDSDSLTLAQQNMLQQYGALQAKLREIEFQRMQAEGELAVAQSFERRNIDDLRPPSETLVNSATFSRLEEEITVLEAQLASTRGSFGPFHPSVTRMEQQLGVQKQLLARRRKEAERRAKMQAQMESLSGQGPEVNIANLISRIQVLKKQEEVLKLRVDSLEEKTLQLGRSSIEIEMMRSEIASAEGILQSVGSEIERTKIELNTPPRVQLVEECRSATPPDYRKRIVKSSAASLLGFALPFVLLAGWDMSRRKVDAADDASRMLELNTLGTIPRFRDPLGRNAGNNDRKAEMQEAIDSLSAMVDHRSEMDEQQVFMVTSAVAGEGKTTVSCQLARSLSRFGKKVVLVDFDLRRPSIDRYLDLDAGPGVSEILGGNQRWADCVQHDECGLAVITAGHQRVQVKQQFTAGSLQRLLRDLRICYDIVIVDACPVLPVVDARLLSKCCDGTIVTLVRDVSRLPSAADACQILRSHGAHMLGTVVIGTRASTYPGGHYYEDLSPAGVASGDAPRGRKAR